MISIIVGNSTSCVKGANPEQFEFLRNKLSHKTAAYGVFRIDESMRHRLIFSPKGVFFRDALNKATLVFDRYGKRVMAKEQAKGSITFKGNWSRVDYYLDKRGHFPTGLLYIIEPFVSKHIEDQRVKPAARPGLLPEPKFAYTPYPEQLEAAEACSSKHRGIVVAPTAFGKSAVIALIAHRLQVKTLCVVPSLELKRQLISSLRAIFGVSSVGSLAEGKAIAVENDDALDPKAKADYDCVIIDEFHHAAATTYRKLNKGAWSTVYHRFGLTATPFRTSEDERLMLESVLAEVIYRVPYADAVAKRYIAPVEAYVCNLPKVEVDGYTYSEVYEELIVNNTYRNGLVCNLVNRLSNSGAKTLVLVKQIVHGEALKEFLLSEFGLWVPFANGQDDASAGHIKAFSEGKLTSLIATSIVGEGVDTRAAEWVLLAGGTGKSRGQIMQNCGRVFRNYPGKESGKVIVFKETSHRWFVEQHELFVTICKEEYSLEPIELG